MAGEVLLVLAGASAAGCSLVLRFAWSLPRRSSAWNAMGWGLFGLGTLLGWSSAGAWGSAVASLFGMASALLLLGHAAVKAPPATGARASNRRAGMLPAGGEPWHLRRRIATFLIVVLGAMVVSVGLAVAARGLVAWSGAGEANANVASFFTMPLAWALLAFALLVEERRARQWRLLAVSAVPGVLAAMAGAVA